MLQLRVCKMGKGGGRGASSPRSPRVPRDLRIPEHLWRPSPARCEAPRRWFPAAVTMLLPPTHSRLIAYSREGLAEKGPEEAGRQEFLLSSRLHRQLAALPRGSWLRFPICEVGTLPALSRDKPARSTRQIFPRLRVLG